jgi:hypothetical protein
MPVSHHACLTSCLSHIMPVSHHACLTSCPPRLMFASKSDAGRALKLNKKNMGSRYIQVFEMSQQDWTSGTAGTSYYDLPVAVASVTCHVVKLKGLPFSARQTDIVNFFAEGGYHISDTAVVMYALYCTYFELHLKH